MADLLTNDALINEILKNMTPEDAAQMGQTAQSQGLGHVPTDAEANASAQKQLALGNIPTIGSLGGMSASQPLVGPLAPTPMPTRAPTSQPAVAPDNLTNLMAKYQSAIQPSERPSVSDILSKLNGQTNPEMLAAMNARNQMQLFSLLGKSANQILGGQTHTKPSNEIFDALAKQGEQGIQDVNTRNQLTAEQLKQQDVAQKLSEEQIKNDPKSAVSILATQITKKMFPEANVTEGQTSASDLDKINPMLSSYATKLLSQQLAAQRFDAMNDYRNRSLGNREDTAANTLYDKNLGQFANRIEGANRAQDVLNQVKSGKIIDTNSLYNALNSEITQLFMNVQSGGSLTDREEGRINSLQASRAKLAAYVGKPMSAIPKDFLPQLEQEIGLLKHDYLDAYKRKSLELQQGTTIEGKQNVYKNREKAFLQNQGINPDTLQDHHQDDEAIDWAKKNPEDPRSAAILQANGVKPQQ